MAESHLVVISGRQLWPNIESILAFDGKLTQLTILHTADHANSLIPAIQLKRLASARFPDLKIGILESPADPYLIGEWVQAEIRSEPRALWTFNITGGLKTMALGITLGVATLPETQREKIRLVYLEIGKDWAELKIAKNGLLERVEKPFVPRNVDSLEISELIQAHFEESISISSVTPQNLAVIQMINAGIVNGWNWNDLQNRFDSQSGQAGFAFERFVAATAQLLGAKTAINVKGSADGRELFEMDVICLLKDRLVFIDCKLRPLGKGRMQYWHGVAKRAERVGGLQARAMMLMPSEQRISESEIRYAEALGVELLGAEECPYFIGRLAGLLSSSLTPELQAAHEKLSRQPFAFGRPQVAFPIAGE